MYVKKCDKVAQENAGTDSIKRLSFFIPCFFGSAVCSRSNAYEIGVTQPVTVLKPDHLSLQSLFRTPYLGLSIIFAHLTRVYLLSFSGTCFVGIIFQRYFFV